MIPSKRLLSPEMEMKTFRVGVPADPLQAVKYEFIEGEVVKTKVGKCYPLVEQDMYADQLVRFLNKEIAFDKGRWRCVWTQPRRSYWNRISGLFHAWVPTLLECQYVDKDGDIPCLVDMEENIWDLLEHFSFTHIAELCNQAYETYRDVEKVVDVKEAQKYSPVHGQLERNPHEKIPDLF